MSTLAVIPARGGSQELKRKNLLPINGVPAVIRSAQAAQDAGCQVVISTEDPEVTSLAHLHGFEVHQRPDHLLDCPVDEVVRHVANQMAWAGPVLLVQPTVQPITKTVLEQFLWAASGLPHAAEQAGQPCTLGTQDRHLIWHDGEVLTDRLQRQEEAEWPVRELGVRWWPSLPLTKPSRVIISTHTLTDIDTASDYRQTQKPLSIQFHVDAYKEIGWGHLHRALTLAEGLQHHNVAINLNDSDLEAQRVLDSRGWPTHTEPVDEWPDVTVLDVLDNWQPHTTPIVALETTLPGATATINALYGHGDYTGSRYAVLRPEFTTQRAYQVREQASRVMVMFGGTDPSGFAHKTMQALWGMTVDVIKPGDKRGIAAAMHSADLLITSGGRTVFEAAAVGIPTLVLCQNTREMSHTHLNQGNLSMGLGHLVNQADLRAAVEMMLGDYTLRKSLHDAARSSIDPYGADRVRAVIEHVARFGEKP